MIFYVKTSTAEIHTYVENNSPDLLLVAETKWSENSQKNFFKVEGYDFHHVERNRAITKKAGGGLLILHKEGVKIHFWDNNTAQVHDRVQNERMWAICEFNGVKYAVGCAYMAAASAGTKDDHEAWNESLFQLLEDDITKLRKDGLQVILQMDSNGWIGSALGGALRKNHSRMNTNGQNTVAFACANNLYIMNDKEKNGEVFTREQRCWAP